MVQNQPYDESLEVSDGEEIASTNATPRGLDQTGTSGITRTHIRLRDNPTYTGVGDGGGWY